MNFKWAKIYSCCLVDKCNNKKMKTNNKIIKNIIKRVV